MQENGAWLGKRTRSHQTGRALPHKPAMQALSTPPFHRSGPWSTRAAGKFANANNQHEAFLCRALRLEPQPRLRRASQVRNADCITQQS